MRLSQCWSILLAGLLLGLSQIARAEPTVAADADAVLQAYVDAVGGRAALARIQSRRMQTTISSGLLRMKVTSRLQRPDRFEDESSFLGFSAGAGYDGQRGWTRKGSTIEPVQGVELARLLRGHSLDWDQQFGRWYPTRKRLADAEVEGVKVRVVELTASTGEKEIWRFDAGSGLLLQLEGYKFEKDKPPVRVISTLSDYRLVDGVRLPFQMKGAGEQREYRIVVTALEHNQPGEPIRFPTSD